MALFGACSLVLLVGLAGLIKLNCKKVRSKFLMFFWPHFQIV